jgi:hypothetical protein
MTVRDIKSISRDCLGLITDAKKGLVYYVRFCCVVDAEIMQGESEMNVQSADPLIKHLLVWTAV